MDSMASPPLKLAGLEAEGGPANSRETLLVQFVKDRAAYLGYLFVLTKDAHLAEDLLQEVFLVVVRELNRFEPSRDFAAWVRGICRKLAQAELRNRQRQIPSAHPELQAAVERACEAEDLAERAARSEQMRVLRRCLERLSMHIREALRLRYAEGLSLDALAARVGKSPKAVQMLLSRARETLARCVKKGALANHDA